MDQASMERQIVQSFIDVCYMGYPKQSNIPIALQHELEVMIGRDSDYNEETGILSIKDPKDGSIIAEWMCNPIVPNKGVLIQPIKAGVFIPTSKNFMDNQARFRQVRNHASNWQHLQTVGYFGARKTGFGYIHTAFTFCMPEDYIPRQDMNKKIMLTLLNNKITAPAYVELDGPRILEFPIKNWMRDTIMEHYADNGVRQQQVIYIFGRTVEQQYTRFKDRCIAYFKERED